MIAVLVVVVRTNITHINAKQKRPIKNIKKVWPAPAEASKKETRKKRPFFRKIRPYKQRQEERSETVQIKNYDESEANNNDQQNEHTFLF